MNIPQESFSLERVWEYEQRSSLRVDWDIDTDKSSLFGTIVITTPTGVSMYKIKI